MDEIKIGRIVLGICETNCYFVYRENNREVLFFDPADVGEYIFDELKEKGFSVGAILLTHGHFDHIWGCEELQKLSGAEVYALDKEIELCENSKNNYSAACGRACTVKPEHYVKDGDELSLCGMKIKVIATPGHTVGSCCYYIEEAGFLVSGDTLFAESVGRTDLPTGSTSMIIRSIKEKLFLLPDDTKVYPGHGDETQIGYEKRYNPFVQ